MNRQPGVSALIFLFIISLKHIYQLYFNKMYSCYFSGNHDIWPWWPFKK